ncbi:PAS domain-containing protein [Nitrospira sp. Kam-Ns4a]
MLVDTDPTFSLRELIDASPAIMLVIDTGRWQVCYQNRSGLTQLGPLAARRASNTLPTSSPSAGSARPTRRCRRGL